MWIEKLVKVNSITRPGTKLKGVRKIVNHYTANPGASAHNHYLYFNGTAIAQKRYASAHIFVDKTEAYLIIPLNEVAYHANDGTYRGVPELKPNANLYSIGVELCIEKDGSFHPETLRRAAEINAELCKRFKLDPQKDIVRHYDVTRKNCPALWVSNPHKFTEFKNMVAHVMKPKGSIIYEAHVQSIGWQGKRKDGETAGTTGQSKRLEALTVKLEGINAKLEMEAHIQGKGWTSVRTNGEIVGTVGESLRLESIKLRCDNRTILYRVHVQGIGWTNWKKNGEAAGTTGQSKRVEAIEIKLQ